MGTFPNIPTVRELEPEGKGKSARAAAAIIRAEQGTIWLPYPNDQTNPWVGPFEEELYSFTGKKYPNGPYASLTFDASGNLYGTTMGGGVHGNGAVFKLAPVSGGGADGPKGGGVVEDGMPLGMARHAIDLPFVD